MSALGPKLDSEISDRYSVSGNGKPVFLVHGLAGRLNSWDSNISTLSEAHTVYDIVLPDYAHQPKQGYGVDELAQYVYEIIDDLRLGATTIIGNSMGGQIAIVLAAEKPTHVNKLVLSAPGLDRLQNNSLNGVRRPTRESLQRIAETVFFDKSLCTSELVDDICTLYDPATSPENQGRFRGFLRTGIRGSTYDMSHFRDTISQQCLVIVGANDEVTSPDRVKEIVPGSHFVELNECGHAPQIEQAKTFNRLTLDFLAED